MEELIKKIDFHEKQLSVLKNKLYKALSTKDVECTTEQNNRIREIFNT